MTRSEARKKLWADPVFREKMRLSHRTNTGFRHSEEAKRRISAAVKLRGAPKNFPEIQKKAWEANRGPQSPEHKAKRIAAVMAAYSIRPKKIYRPYIHVRDAKYKLWRNQVFERDDWVCQDCRVRGGYLEAHHLKSWTNFPDLRFVLDNGLTLCTPCHKLTDNYKGKAKNANR